MALAAFLKGIRRDLLSFQSSPPQTVHIVIGNESCDLDSVVSTLVYAFFLNSTSKRPPPTLLPILNVSRHHFHLRLEVNAHLTSLGIHPADHLIFIDDPDLDLVALTGSGVSLAVTLVDHHQLSETEECLRPFVVEAIDHRPLGEVLPESWQTEIERVGSCASLVAHRLMDHGCFTVDPVSAQLLLGAILSDTVNLSVADGIATEKDHWAVCRLEGSLPAKVTCQGIYDLIKKAKFDLSGLTVGEMLRKDLKIVRGSHISVALASITMDLEEVLQRVEFAQHAAAFCADLPADVVLILTIGMGDTSISRRCVAVFSHSRLYREQITDVLLRSVSPNLGLQLLNPPVSLQDHVTAFNQSNLRISRKGILPLINQFLCGEADTDLPRNEDSNNSNTIREEAEEEERREVEEEEKKEKEDAFCEMQMRRHINLAKIAQSDHFRTSQDVFDLAAVGTRSVISPSLSSDSASCDFDSLDRKDSYGGGGSGGFSAAGFGSGFSDGFLEKTEEEGERERRRDSDNEAVGSVGRKTSSSLLSNQMAEMERREKEKEGGEEESRREEFHRRVSDNSSSSNPGHHTSICNEEKDDDDAAMINANIANNNTIIMTQSVTTASETIGLPFSLPDRDHSSQGPSHILSQETETTTTELESGLCGGGGGGSGNSSGGGGGGQRSPNKAPPSYPETPPNSYCMTPVLGQDPIRQTHLPSFNSKEMVAKIQQKKQAMSYNNNGSGGGSSNYTNNSIVGFEGSDNNNDDNGDSFYNDANSDDDSDEEASMMKKKKMMMIKSSNSNSNAEGGGLSSLSLLSVLGGGLMKAGSGGGSLMSPVVPQNSYMSCNDIAGTFGQVESSSPSASSPLTTTTMTTNDGTAGGAAAGGAGGGGRVSISGGAGVDIPRLARAGIEEKVIEKRSHFSDAWSGSAVSSPGIEGFTFTPQNSYAADFTSGGEGCLGVVSAGVPSKGSGSCGSTSNNNVSGKLRAKQAAKAMFSGGGGGGGGFNSEDSVGGGSGDFGGSVDSPVHAYTPHNSYKDVSVMMGGGGGGGGGGVLEEERGADLNEVANRLSAERVKRGGGGRGEKRRSGSATTDSGGGSRDESSGGGAISRGVVGGAAYDVRSCGVVAGGGGVNARHSSSQSDSANTMSDVESLLSTSLDCCGTPVLDNTTTTAGGNSNSGGGGGANSSGCHGNIVALGLVGAMRADVTSNVTSTPTTFSSGTPKDDNVFTPGQGGGGGGGDAKNVFGFNQVDGDHGDDDGGAGGGHVSGSSGENSSNVNNHLNGTENVSSASTSTSVQNVPPNSISDGGGGFGGVGLNLFDNGDAGVFGGGCSRSNSDLFSPLNESVMIEGELEMFQTAESIVSQSIAAAALQMNNSGAIGAGAGGGGGGESAAWGGMVNGVEDLSHCSVGGSGYDDSSIGGGGLGIDSTANNDENDINDDDDDDEEESDFMTSSFSTTENTEGEMMIVSGNARSAEFGGGGGNCRNGKRSKSVVTMFPTTNDSKKAAVPGMKPKRHSVGFDLAGGGNGAGGNSGGGGDGDRMNSLNKKGLENGVKDFGGGCGNGNSGGGGGSGGDGSGGGGTGSGGGGEDDSEMSDAVLSELAYEWARDLIQGVLDNFPAEEGMGLMMNCGGGSSSSSRSGGGGGGSNDDGGSVEKGGGRVDDNDNDGDKEDEENGRRRKMMSNLPRLSIVITDTNDGVEGLLDLGGGGVGDNKKIKEEGEEEDDDDEEDVDAFSVEALDGSVGDIYREDTVDLDEDEEEEAVEGEVIEDDDVEEDEVEEERQLFSKKHENEDKEKDDDNDFDERDRELGDEFCTDGLEEGEIVGSMRKGSNSHINPNRKWSRSSSSSPDSSITSSAVNPASSGDRKWSRDLDVSATPIQENEVVTSFPERRCSSEVRFHDIIHDYDDSPITSFPGRKISISEDYPRRISRDDSSSCSARRHSNLVGGDGMVASGGGGSDNNNDNANKDGVGGNYDADNNNDDDDNNDDEFGTREDLETEYLPSMDPLHGNLDIVGSNQTNALSKMMTDSDREVVEGESFRRVSGHELPGSGGEEGLDSTLTASAAAVVMGSASELSISSKMDEVKRGGEETKDDDIDDKVDVDEKGKDVKDLSLSLLSMAEDDEEVGQSLNPAVFDGEEKALSSSSSLPSPGGFVEPMTPPAVSEIKKAKKRIRVSFSHDVGDDEAEFFSQAAAGPRSPRTLMKSPPPPPSTVSSSDDRKEEEEEEESGGNARGMDGVGGYSSGGVVAAEGFDPTRDFDSVGFGEDDDDYDEKDEVLDDVWRPSMKQAKEIYLTSAGRISIAGEEEDEREGGGGVEKEGRGLRIKSGSDGSVKSSSTTPATKQGISSFSSSDKFLMDTVNTEEEPLDLNQKYSAVKVGGTSSIGVKQIADADDSSSNCIPSLSPSLPYCVAEISSSSLFQSPLPSSLSKPIVDVVTFPQSSPLSSSSSPLSSTASSALRLSSSSSIVDNNNIIDNNTDDVHNDRLCSSSNYSSRSRTIHEDVSSIPVITSSTGDKNSDVNVSSSSNNSTNINQHCNENNSIIRSGGDDGGRTVHCQKSSSFSVSQSSSSSSSSPLLLTSSSQSLSSQQQQEENEQPQPHPSLSSTSSSPQSSSLSSSSLLSQRLHHQTNTNISCSSPSVVDTVTTTTTMFTTTTTTTTTTTNTKNSIIDGQNNDIIITNTADNITSRHTNPELSTATSCVHHSLNSDLSPCRVTMTPSSNNPNPSHQLDVVRTTTPPPPRNVDDYSDSDSFQCDTATDTDTFTKTSIAATNTTTATAEDVEDGGFGGDNDDDDNNDDNKFHHQQHHHPHHQQNEDKKNKKAMTGYEESTTITTCTTIPSINSTTTTPAAGTNASTSTSSQSTSPSAASANSSSTSNSYSSNSHHQDNGNNTNNSTDNGNGSNISNNHQRKNKKPPGLDPPVTLNYDPLLRLGQSQSGTSLCSVKGAEFRDEWQDDDIQDMATTVESRKTIMPDANLRNDIDDDDDDDDDDVIDDNTENDLEWENDTPVTQPPSDRDLESHDQSRFRTVQASGSLFEMDMELVSPYKAVLSHGGYYDEGLTAVIVFYGYHLPHRQQADYKAVMNHIFHHVIAILDEWVAEDYVIVYFHGSTPKQRMPGFHWLRKCYHCIDRRLKKNLRGLYLVHPTLWLRTVVAMTRPFISSKFSSKLKFVRDLHELKTLVPLDNVTIPPAVLYYDRYKQHLPSSQSTTPTTSSTSQRHNPSSSSEPQPSSSSPSSPHPPHPPTSSLLSSPPSSHTR